MTLLDNLTKIQPLEQQIEQDLNQQGCAVIKQLISEEDCEGLARFYQAEGHGEGTSFRSHINMKRHGFGQGEYKYFSYPLPTLVESLRTELYPGLAAIANRWNQVMKIEQSFPDNHQAYLDQCHAAGQLKPTPLLLQYGAGDYNCLHQDVYGDLLFPLQVACLLSKPGDDFTGGEFVLTEQRPRMQSRAEVVPLEQGDAVVFPVRHRPKEGTRGIYRVNMRHGVSQVRSGRRHTLGLIFHDAS